MELGNANKAMAIYFIKDTGAFPTETLNDTGMMLFFLNSRFTGNGGGLLKDMFGTNRITWDTAQLVVTKLSEPDWDGIKEDRQSQM